MMVNLSRRGPSLRRWVAQLGKCVVTIKRRQVRWEVREMGGWKMEG
jgi:hypothetical protein